MRQPDSRTPLSLSRSAKVRTSFILGIAMPGPGRSEDEMADMRALRELLRPARRQIMPPDYIGPLGF